MDESIEERGRRINFNNKYVRLSWIVSLCIIGVVWFRLAIGGIPILDQWTMEYAKTIPRNSSMYTFFTLCTILGSKVFLVPFTLLLSIPFYRMFTTMIPWLFLSLGTLFTYLANTGVKAIVQRERPRIAPELSAEGFSFPSGHAMISLVFYGLLMYMLFQYFSHRLMKITIFVTGFLCIGCIGVSRYILNVHYASDIMVGYFIGWIFLMIIVGMYKQYIKLREK